MLRILSKFCLFITLALLGITPVYAADKSKTVSLEQASEYVRQQSKGKVLSARTTKFNGDKAHRIQVLTPSGRVKIFQIPVKINANRKLSHYQYPQGKTKSSSIRTNNSNYSNSTRTYAIPKSSTTTSKGNNKEK